MLLRAHVLLCKRAILNDKFYMHVYTKSFWNTSCILDWGAGGGAGGGGRGAGRGGIGYIFYGTSETASPAASDEMTTSTTTTCNEVQRQIGSLVMVSPVPPPPSRTQVGT